jgi:hypothetical protein
MKRIGIAGLLVVIACALSAVGAGSASAAYTCMKVRWFAWYHKFGSPQCEELAIIFAWKGWDLVDLVGALEPEPGVFCALVEAGSPSNYDGPKCGPSEEHEGKSEYIKTASEKEVKEEKDEEEKGSGENTKLLPIPTATSPVSTTAKGGESTLVALGGQTVVCKKSKGGAAFTTPNLGTGSVLFEECTSTLSTTCTGTGDATGTLQESGSVHYLLALEMITSLTTTLVVAFAFLVKQFHFVCKSGIISLLALVRGCVAAKADGVGTAGTLAKIMTLLFAQFTTGETKILSILMEGNTKETKCLLESTISEKEGETFTLAALVDDVVLEKWKQVGTEMEMLFMN